MLQTGDPAPDFSLSDQDGATHSLAGYRGRKLLIYFYPRADTPGCTRQSCAVRDARGDLDGRNVAAVGISPDTPKDQKKFDDKFELGFPLLADHDHQVAEAYGVWASARATAAPTWGSTALRSWWMRRATSRRCGTE